MTLDALLIALQITVPSALFGAVIVGGASPAVAHWLGRRRRPFRVGGRRRPVAPAAKAEPTPVDFAIIPAGTRAAGPYRVATRERRAA